jgi:hypothetical protein
MAPKTCRAKGSTIIRSFIGFWYEWGVNWLVFFLVKWEFLKKLKIIFLYKTKRSLWNFIFFKKIRRVLG